MKRVLIVDDNPLNAEVSRLVMARAKHEAFVVERGDLALDWLIGNRADAILADISMPGMSGKELCRQIRARYGMMCPRLVAYTAYSQPHQRVTIAAAGFDYVLLKPARAEELLQAVFPAATLAQHIPI